MTAIAAYLDLWKQALREDRARRVEQRTRFESTEFLPAALAVLETPPSPLGRGLLLALAAIVLVAVLWAAFGRLDVVVSASGKLIPLERVKIIQSADGGVVRAIGVHDGQQVRAGQMLIALDPTDAGADVAQVQRALENARVAAARADALLSYAKSGEIRFVAPPGTAPTAAASQDALLRSQIAGLRAQLADLAGKRAEALSMAQAASREVSRLADTLPLLSERVARRKSLADKGYSSQIALLEMQQQEMDHKRSIGIKGSERARYDGTVRSIDSQVVEARQGFIKDAADLLSKSQDEIALREEELRKAARRNSLQRLTAPSNGIVQQLAVHTLGAVVKPADPIMTVVPIGGPIELEATILNRDMAKIRAGQPVSVKLDAYGFTRYGTVPGRLLWVSSDAVQNEKLGLIYQARVRLDRRWILVDGRRVTLGPGLSATVDIHTGSRSILEYLLSPVARSVREAGREA